jgi:hypothetical protein
VRRSHAVLVGSCLVVAPALNAIGDALTPAYAPEVADALAGMAAHPRRHFAASGLWLVSLLVEVPAVVGLGALGGGRAVPLARFGRGMALTGMGALAVLTVHQVKLGVMAAGERPVDTGAVERVTDSGSYAALVLLSELHLLGLVALALALRRASVGPAAATGLVVAGAVGLLLASYVPSRALYVGASFVLAAGLAAIGVRLLRGVRRGAAPALDS